MSDDTSDIAQLSIAAQGITESSEVAEEIVLQSLHGTTAGYQSFWNEAETISENIREMLTCVSFLPVIFFTRSDH